MTKLLSFPQKDYLPEYIECGKIEYDFLVVIVVLMLYDKR